MMPDTRARTNELLVDEKFHSRTEKGTRLPAKCGKIVAEVDECCVAPQNETRIQLIVACPGAMLVRFVAQAIPLSNVNPG